MRVFFLVWSVCLRDVFVCFCLLVVVIFVWCCCCCFLLLLYLLLCWFFREFWSVCFGFVFIFWCLVFLLWGRCRGVDCVKWMNWLVLVSYVWILLWFLWFFGLIWFLILCFFGVFKEFVLVDLKLFVIIVFVIVLVF